MQKNGKALAVTGLVLGVLALFFSLILAWIFPIMNIPALICAIVGIVLSVMGNKQARAAGLPTGLGTAGMILSIIGTVVAAIGFFSCTLCYICACSSLCAAESAAEDFIGSLF